MSEPPEGARAHRSTGPAPPSPAFRLGLRLLSWGPVLVISTIILLIPSEIYIKTIVADDALYYPIIARNIARGLGSTYDNGLTSTNGYHPLWTWLQVPIALIFGSGSRFTYLWWIKALVVGTVLLSLYVWGLVMGRIFDDDVPVMTYRLLLGGYYWSVSTLYSGMETPLIVLMMGLVLLQTLKTVDRPTLSLWPGTLLGILIAATFLSRLDSVLFLSALSVPIILILNKRHQLKALLLSYGTAAIAIAPYLAWNLAHFGHIIPVSGLKKTPGLELTERWAQLASFWVRKWEKLSAEPGWASLALLILIVLGTIIAVARRDIVTAVKRFKVIWALPVGAILHYLYTSLFMNEGDVYWYHYAEYLTVYLILSAMVYAVTLWCRRSGMTRLAYLPVLGIAVSILGMLAMHPLRILPGSVNVLTFEAGIWANRHASSTSRFGMYDSGVFSFVSDRSTMSLNGLAGDRELLALTLARDMRSIIDRYKLDYVVTVIPESRLETLDSSQVAYLSPNFRVARYHFGMARYAILGTDIYREGRRWQLSDSSLCRYHAILQEGCPKVR